MSEKPKSIWNKPWKGWRGLLAWLVILAAAIFFAVFAISLAWKAPKASTGEILVQSLVVTSAAWLVSALLILFIRWACCWRNFRRMLFGLACVATLIALFYAEENIRGKLAWNSYVREVEARGDTLDLAKLIPPPVPDAQNFTLCPLLKPVFDFTWHEPADAANFDGGRMERHDTNGLARLDRLSVYSAVEDYIRSLPPDHVHPDSSYRAKRVVASLKLLNGWVNLRAFEDYLLVGTNLTGVALTDSSATNLVLALRPFNSDLEALRDCSSQRALDRWSILYNTNNPYAILLPHLARVKQFCQFLRLPASANLASGNTSGAIDDMRLAHRFAESVRDEPFLISQLVRVASHRLNVQPLKEGLARHQFTEPQLRQLQEQYRSADLLSGAVNSMCGERSFAIVSAKQMKRNPKLMDLLDGTYLYETVPNKPVVAVSFRLAPTGWLRQNQVTIGRIIDSHIIGAVDRQSKLIDLQAATSLETAIEELSLPHGLIAQLLVPGISKALIRFAEGQTQMDQAVIACALERYHLVNGEYPEELTALSPQFLEEVPHDINTGDAMIYSTLPDGYYILYSVGWDGNDDGGRPRQGTRYDPDNDEDWVWQLPDPNLQPY